MENGKCPHCGYEAGDAKVCPCCGKKINGTMSVVRSPLADAGLMLGVSLLVIIMIKSLMFGFTWLGTAWLAVDVVYILLWAKCRRGGRLVKTSTIWFMSFSLIALVLLFAFDEEAKPKMPVFQGTHADTLAGSNSLETEVLDDEPITEPEPVVEDSIDVSMDSTSYETVAASKHDSLAVDAAVQDSL